MSEWVIIKLFNAKEQFSAISWWEQVTFWWDDDDDMMMFTLYWTNMQNWIFIVLAHWNNSLRVDMSQHSDTLTRFRANQSLFLLLNTACFAGKHTYQFFSLWFHPTGLEPTIYNTRRECDNHYIIDTIVLHMIWRSNMNERLRDMTPYGMLYNVSVFFLFFFARQLWRAAPPLFPIL